MASETDRIEKKVLLRAPQARVWRALTDSKEFGNWFGVRFDAPFKPGVPLVGAVTPTTADAEVAKLQKTFEGAPFAITIDRIEPQRLFSFRWHPFAVERDFDYSSEPTTLVSFELEEVPQGILLTISESGFDGIPIARRAKAFTANEGGWAMQVKLIEKHLVQNP
jgi:uncharacterized protein YndB with AHSA1/START domain